LPNSQVTSTAEDIIELSGSGLVRRMRVFDDSWTTLLNDSLHYTLISGPLIPIFSSSSFFRLLNGFLVRKENEKSAQSDMAHRARYTGIVVGLGKGWRNLQSINPFGVRGTVMYIVSFHTQTIYNEHMKFFLRMFLCDVLSKWRDEKIW